MLRGPNGKKIDIHKEANNQRLRGERLEEIRKDLNNDNLDDEQKLMKYSSHLDWFMSKVKELTVAMEFWKSPNKWSMTRKTLGFTNGLIIALAIFLEEKGDPPVIKKDPPKYGKDDNELVEEQVKGFMINLSRQLECIICMGEDGWPVGYDDCESIGMAWLQWRNDTIQYLDSCPVDFPEIRMIIERIQEFNEKLQDQQE